MEEEKAGRNKERKMGREERRWRRKMEREKEGGDLYLNPWYMRKEALHAL